MIATVPQLNKLDLEARMEKGVHSKLESVIGIDFGNDACYIAVARASSIEIIANDYSLRMAP